MKDQIIIRPYQEQDKQQLIQICQVFGEYMQKLDEPYLDMMVVSDNYGELLLARTIEDIRINNGIILVAEKNSQIIGFAACITKLLGQEPEDDCKPHKMGRVTELYIDEKYRGQSIGSRLLEHLTEYLMNQSCFKINIEVFAPNQKALKFYQKNGFEIRNYDLTKVIHNS